MIRDEAREGGNNPQQAWINATRKVQKMCMKLIDYQCRLIGKKRVHVIDPDFLE